MGKHEIESRVERFYRMFGKDCKVADYYKIEKDVEKLFEIVGELNRRMTEIEASRRKCGRPKSENGKVRDSFNAVLDAMEADGFASHEAFENMETSDATMRVFTYSDVKGLGLERTRGNRTILTRVIRDRYGFKLNNNRFSAELEEVKR